MQIPYATNEKPLTLKIVVQTGRPENIGIRVLDAQKIPGTNRTIGVYADRYQIVNGKATFFVKMPVSPKVALVQVFNISKGNLAEGQDNSFRFTMTPIPLERGPFPLNINRSKAVEFMEFMETFAKFKNIISAGYGSTPNSIYKSHDGTFEIHYYDVLRDTRKYMMIGEQMIPNPNYGREITTPMRTHKESKIFEISQKYTADYTVPETEAIGAHEFAHVFVNDVPADEEEADRNGAAIVMWRGNDKISTYNAFLKVFRNADTIQNRKRERKLYEFIKNYNVGDAFLIGA